MRILLLVFVPLLLTVLLILALDTRLLTRRYQIAAKGLSRQVRLVLLTDLHATPYGDRQERLLREVKACAPDLVLMAGDMVDRRRSTREAEHLYRGLSAYPSYYVIGNHECGRADLEALKARAKACGVTVLTNETVTVACGGEFLQISGIDDPECRRHKPDFDHQTALVRLRETAAQRPGYRILIAHKPEWIARYSGFDLVVAGHTHGGMIRIPGLINGLIVPGQGLFPKWIGGVYQHEDTTLVISRGLSRHLIRPRVCNRPELVVIELMPE